MIVISNLTNNYYYVNYDIIIELAIQITKS